MLILSLLKFHGCDHELVYHMVLVYLNYLWTLLAVLQQNVNPDKSLRTGVECKTKEANHKHLIPLLFYKGDSKPLFLFFVLCLSLFQNYLIPLDNAHLISHIGGPGWPSGLGS